MSRIVAIAILFIFSTTASADEVKINYVLKSAKSGFLLVLKGPKATHLIESLNYDSGLLFSDDSKKVTFTKTGSEEYSLSFDKVGRADVKPVVGGAVIASGELTVGAYAKGKIQLVQLRIGLGQDDVVDTAAKTLFRSLYRLFLDTKLETGLKAEIQRPSVDDHSSDSSFITISGENIKCSSDVNHKTNLSLDAPGLGPWCDIDIYTDGRIAGVSDWANVLAR